MSEQHKSWKDALYFHWGFDNAKFKSTRTRDNARIAGFSLPAGKTCPGKGVCASYCYAQQGHFQGPTVKVPHEANLRMVRYWLGQSVTALATRLFHDLDILEKHGFDGIRLHVAGDFFDEEYLKAWVQAADRVGIRLYAYTKSIKVLMHVMQGMLVAGERWPDNLVLTQSTGGSQDYLINPALPIATIVTTEEDMNTLVGQGWVDGSYSDFAAFCGERRIAFRYHGYANRSKLVQSMKCADL